jgi:ribosomal protein S20
VPLITIIDVLENALGELTHERIQRLTRAEIEALAQGVNAFYDSWEAPPVGPDDLRMYSGGWIAGNAEAEDARQYLYSSLLYAPSVVLHDPVAEWFDPHRKKLQAPPPLRVRSRQISSPQPVLVAGSEPHLLQSDGYFVFRDDPERTRLRLMSAVPLLSELAPLIRSGVVVPIPQWKLVREFQRGLLTAVRYDVQDATLAAIVAGAASDPPPRSDHIRGGTVMVGDGFIPADEQRALLEGPAYFLNKTLMLAEATSSRYSPPATTDAALLRHRLERLGDSLRRKDIDLQVVAGLIAADLPFLGSLDAKTIVAIHEAEEAFAAWRSELRTIVRAVESTQADGPEFELEAREVISDALLPRATEVQRAVSRSTILRNAASDQATSFGLDAISIAGAAVAAGSGLGSAAFLGLGLSAIGRAAYAGIFGPAAATRAHGVLATLVMKRP